jgi:hypothetical protein
MKKIILAAAGALVLVACGSGTPNEPALHDRIGSAVDEAALAGAVSQSIDRKALEDVARDAVVGAVREAVPAEIQAVGSVVDEKKLLKGIGQAVDEELLGGAVQGAIMGADKSAER